MTTTAHRAGLLTPEQVAQAQRLAAASLTPRAIAGVLEVPEERLLRSFRQAAREVTSGDPAMWGLDDCEPIPDRRRR